MRSMSYCCRIEHDHPLLADCEGHWKARELLQQVIDNGIDEMTLHRKKVSGSQRLDAIQDHSI